MVCPEYPGRWANCDWVDDYLPPIDTAPFVFMRDAALVVIVFMALVLIGAFIYAQTD